MNNDLSVLGSKCFHGMDWKDCPEKRCKSIFKLYREQVIDERLGKRTPIFQPLENEDGETTKDTEVAVDENSPDIPGTPGYSSLVEQELLDKDLVIRKKKELPVSLSPKIFQAMVQAGAIDSRQADVLCARLTGMTWSKIAKNLGASVRTARRLTEQNRIQLQSAPCPFPTGSIVSRNITGERKARKYKVIKFKFGQWEQTFYELLTNDQTSTVKNKIVLKPARQSPMRNLFGALIGYFGQVGLRTRPAGVSPAEWKFNITHAERVLLKNRRKVSSLSARDVYYSLGRGKKLCPACRSPILRGFRLNGKRIPRSRDFCDDACKKKAERIARANNSGK